MTEYRVSPVSEFCDDLNRIEDLLDFIEYYAVKPESNPVKKKDVIYILRRIKNLADEMIRKTRLSGYGYFTEPSEVKK